MKRHPNSPQDGDFVELGYVSGIFGVRGEVRLFLHHPESSLLRQWTRVVLLPTATGESITADLKARPGAGKRIIGTFKGHSRRDQAEAIQNWRVVIRAADLPELRDASEFYVRDVLGAHVVVEGAEHVPVGCVTAVHPTADADVLEVRLVDAEEPVFVSCRKEMVKDLDVVGRRVVVSPEALGHEDE